MKRKNTLGALVALALLLVLLSACTPSSLITPAQQTAVAATGMAAANGMLTAIPGSQTAVPSAPSATASAMAGTAGVPVTGSTSLPATVTPSAVPTNGSTAIVPNTGATPTVPATGGAAPTQGVQTGTGCGTAMSISGAGPLATLWINNDTSSPVNLTMGISSANSFGQCGFLTFGPIKPGQSIRVRVPVTQTSLGDVCYWAWALITNQGRQVIVSGDSAGYCITTPTRWVINVHLDRIRLVGP